jgi:putative addiction module component (TIGR02574 family)
MTTRDIIREVEALPVEERLVVVDSLLRSLNPSEPENERKWRDVAERRLADLRAGRARGVSSERLFARIRQRFA